MNPAVNDLNTFLFKIFESIKQTLSTLDISSDRKLLQIRREYHSFYVSLFAPGTGVFPANKIDKELSKRPARVIESPGSPPPQPERAPTGLGRRRPGKGSPGFTRKASVTKRQQRRRETTGLQKRKGSELPAGQQPPLKKLAPKPLATQLAEETSQPTAEDTPPTPKAATEAASSLHEAEKQSNTVADSG